PVAAVDDHVRHLLERGPVRQFGRVPAVGGLHDLELEPAGQRMGEQIPPLRGGGGGVGVDDQQGAHNRSPYRVPGPAGGLVWRAWPMISIRSTARTTSTTRCRPVLRAPCSPPAR